MQWAEPSSGAAIHALTQVHLSLPRYHSLAQIIRNNAIALLSPITTGQGMIHRLQRVSYCLCLIFESHSPQHSLFFSSSCHETVHQQTQLIKETILSEALQHSQSSSSSSPTQPHDSGYGRGEREREGGTRKISTTPPTPEMVIDYCQRYILGKRIFTERHKRLK
jgi:hypothetical protein